ncbi:MAG: hypothetical protein JSS10_08125 [Verrucomicrobia bacterium]|nr:hypothetical protein [Verrucomicrobiota bacterium]
MSITITSSDFYEFEIEMTKAACQSKTSLSLPINFYQGEDEFFTLLSHHFLPYEKLSKSSHALQISPIEEISATILNNHEEELEPDLLKNALLRFTNNGNPSKGSIHLRKPLDHHVQEGDQLNFSIYEKRPLLNTEITIQFAAIYYSAHHLHAEKTYAELPPVEMLLTSSIDKTNDQDDWHEEPLIPVTDVQISPPKSIPKLVRQKTYAELPEAKNLKSSSERACSPVGMDDDFSGSPSSANGDVLSYEDSIRFSEG